LAKVTALSFLLLASCTAPETARKEAAVVNGFEPEDAEATVSLGYFIWGADFVSVCSGSLVAPNVVMTAKHCIPNWVDCQVRGLSVGFGPDGLDDQIRIQSAVCSENSCSGADCPAGWVFQYEDIALVILDEAVDAIGGDLRPLHPAIADIVPYPIAWDGDGLSEDDPVRLIGYGTTEAGTNGHRLATDDVVTTVYDDEFITIGNGVCPGDSGGSAIDAEGRVVGINVRGIDDGCVEPPPERITYLTRVTHWLDVVEEAFDVAGQCTPISEERCDGWDNDCNGETDEGCGFEGDPCDPVRPQTSCAEGFYCRQDGCQAGVCTAGAAGDGPLGSACDEDVDCSSLRCASGACTRACVPGEGMCGLGQVCAGEEATCSVCVDASLAPPGAARGLGEPCAKDGECARGMCRTTLDGRYCTDACRADDATSGTTACPEGWHCMDGDCLRGAPGVVGAPCLDDEVCASGECGRWSDIGWSCTADCSEEEPGPEGASCDASGYCKPLGVVTGEPCTDNGECVSRLCGHFGYADLCTQTCSAWDACPDGFECIAAAEGMQICARPRVSATGGACAVAGEGGEGSWAPWAFAVLLGRRRRPR
jgi:hypothetical protein